MYYLLVRNLDDVRCIDRNTNDVYEDGMSFHCTLSLECKGEKFVREVEITCTENPGEYFTARIYSD